MTRGKGEGAVYKASNGLWTAALELPSYDGKRRRKVIRATTKRAVLEKLQAAKQDLSERGDIITNTVTVQQWFTAWLNTMPDHIRPNTISGYKSVVKNHIVPALGPKTRLEKVTPQHVRKVQKKILAEGLTSTYALNAHRVMSSAFNAAVREGHISTAPTSRTLAPRTSTYTPEALTAPEALALLEKTINTPMGPVWATSLLTGARRGEVIGLERDRTGDYLEISWQLQRIVWQHGCDGGCGRKRGTDCPSRRIETPPDYEYRHLEGGLFLVRPKSRDGWRIIPLVEPLKTLLNAHLNSHTHDLVFNRNGRPIDPDQATSAWTAALKSVDIDKHVVLHGLRNTAVDLLYLAGVPEDIIREIVGHSNVAMTRRYKSKRNIERLRDAMQQMAALVQFDAQTKPVAPAPIPAALERG